MVEQVTLLLSSFADSASVVAAVRGVDVPDQFSRP